MNSPGRGEGGARAHGGRRPRAGRPRSGRVLLVLRVLPEVASTISRLAFTQDKSRGEVVEQFFKQADDDLH